MIPVILSGGNGSRLWPLSRKQYPKQFLKLIGDQTLFQQTIARVMTNGMQNPLIICNQEHRFMVSEQLLALNQSADAIFLEPFGRNTAPAVAIAAMKLLNEGRDELMLILPADHVILNTQAFNKAINKAVPAAEKGEMVLFGITPDKPETGYGYIKIAEKSDHLPEDVFPVAQFVEKPNFERACEFLASGEYCWNSGMFMFKASRYLEELQQHAPDIFDTCALALQQSTLGNDYIHIDRDSFEHCPEDSIDYAVMEKTNRACVIPLTAGWSDVGSWSSLWDVHNKDASGNVLKGDVLAFDSKNCFVTAEGKLITLLGVEDLVIVETKDAVMVAAKDRVQDVKKIVNSLNEASRNEAHSHREVYRPWGSYDSIDTGNRFQVKRITVKPGASLSLQKHHHRAEHWIVVCGTAQVTCDDKIFLLTENQSTYIPIGSVHRLTNPGKVMLEMIEVQSGGYLGEDDIVRLEDVYGRSEKLDAVTM